ncbi:hypothetical protein ACP70R_027011 [Stipagrostis hirtigluma subsp. patula]
MYGFIGLIYSIGSVGSLLGVLLYQSPLKEYPPQHGSMESVAVSLAGMFDRSGVSDPTEPEKWHIGLLLCGDQQQHIVDGCAAQMVATYGA